MFDKGDFAQGMKGGAATANILKALAFIAVYPTLTILIGIHRTSTKSVTEHGQCHVV